MASELDPTSDHIIEFLAESYDTPINAVFFRHFADGGLAYLARTWLLDPHHVEDKAAWPSRRKLRPCNGRDFYVILGRAERGDPRWPIAHKHGFGTRAADRGTGSRCATSTEAERTPSSAPAARIVSPTES
ncbi:MAG: hypothetical protein OXI50_06050 [Gammaproteobacteria bacterium]|nr:hypothetical protein [Gammaproteobacteria bacterium]